MSVLLAACLAASSAARAAPDDAAPACPAPQAPEFAGAKGFRLWVTRQGTMTWTNPLRPLSPESVQVLQVVIRNKVATAYGPDLSGLRRGPSPAALEAQNSATIQWSGAVADLPPTLRILADDGGQVLAELKFQACGDAPKVAEPKASKPVPAARATPKNAPKDASKGASKTATRPDAGKVDAAEAGGSAGAEATAADPAKANVPRASRPRREKAAAPAEPASRTPGGLVLPQGAIP
ncbi:hypothetical protein VQ02_25285 [Methylobacterium variabile]|uniref:Uncharacterized protein n=1 Tax=Methylobacterium variabile TaxID=298794 RepID=A0A0J6S9G9_9HYPH|nr:hypothetical protein [Methylobacterium variabile]KMO31865.1 hypothetical protein VQ02_25285 [Methylobacterium variabile]